MLSTPGQGWSFVVVLLFARDGIQRVVAPPAPVGRPAGKQNRAGAGKPGTLSQADKRRKIIETKRHDSRWKRWSGVGGGEQCNSAGGNSSAGQRRSSGGGDSGGGSGGGGDSSSNSYSNRNSGDAGGGGGISGSGSGSSTAIPRTPASSSSNSIDGQPSPLPVRKIYKFLFYCQEQSIGETTAVGNMCVQVVVRCVAVVLPVPHSQCLL